MPKPPGSMPKPPRSMPKPPGSMPKPPGSMPKPPGSMPKPPGSMPKPPGSMPKPPGSMPKPPVVEALDPYPFPLLLVCSRRGEKLPSAKVQLCDSPPPRGEGDESGSKAFKAPLHGVGSLSPFQSRTIFALDQQWLQIRGSDQEKESIVPVEWGRWGFVLICGLIDMHVVQIGSRGQRSPSKSSGVPVVEVVRHVLIDTANQTMNQQAHVFECGLNLREPSWSSSDGSEFPLVPILVSISIICSAIAIMTTVCLVILCRRKGGHAPSPSGPAHWSTTVTVTPECSRPREPLRSRQEQDRMALIAFADGIQQVTLPSYEEALRDSGTHYVPHLGANEYDNPLTTTSTMTASASNNGHLGTGYRHLGITTTTTRNGRSDHPGRRSRGLIPNGSHRYDNSDALSQHSIHAWPPRPTNGGAHRRRRENDALSDSVSHHSVNMWPRNGGHQLQHQPRSLRSSSGGSASASIETVGGSENTHTHTTLTAGETISNSTNASQTPSCRALAGSLASFDTSSVVNTEGIPLLEENEMETEGSNSSSVS
eukprot:maker-scaffold203_size261420-snap-gene-0.10 protein:Tk10408 transcript:maker-scaffold203_size261420-snap-gene-0.10-mRNA-1 annotation:"hypothetical protein SPRG_14861"